MSSLTRLAPLPLFTAALLLSGCSDSVGPAVIGAYEISFGQGQSGACGLGPHSGQVGSVTDTEKQSLQRDGENLIQMSCIVTGSGSTFRVVGEIDDNEANFLAFDIPSLDTGATRDNPSLGSVQYQAAETQGAVYSSVGDQPCEFFLEGSETIQPGAAWLSFRCPNVIDGSSTCELGPMFPNVVIMENCDQ